MNIHKAAFTVCMSKIPLTQNDGYKFIFSLPRPLEQSNIASIESSGHCGHLSLIASRDSNMQTMKAPLVGDSLSPAAETPVLYIPVNLEFIEGIVSSASPPILEAFFLSWDAFFP